MAKRRAAGLCYSCDRKAYKGGIRCRMHREINRQRCAAWTAKNPLYSANQWAQKKRLREEFGLCPYCRPHRPLRDGYGKCDVCREKSREGYRRRRDRLKAKKATS